MGVFPRRSKRQGSGTDSNDAETLEFLFNWADVIVVMHSDFIFDVPSKFCNKAAIFHVGNDVWGNPFDEELQLKIINALNSRPGYFNFGRVIDPIRVIKRLRDYRAKVASRNLEDTSA